MAISKVDSRANEQRLLDFFTLHEFMGVPNARRVFAQGPSDLWFAEEGGKLVAASRDRCRQIVASLAGIGCQGVILGCTEIGLLLRPADVRVPLFDTAELHAEAAAHRALGG